MSAPDKNGWRPIESAPKERGRHYLLSDGKRVARGYWTPYFGEGGQWRFDDKLDDCGITHWQKYPTFPEPPEAK